MPRVTIAPSRRRKHKRVMRAASGYYGGRSRLFRIATEAVMRAQQYAYRDRRNRKREFRALWITRVGAACRERGFAYNGFISALGKGGVLLNRKMLAEIAIADPKGFDRLAAFARGGAK